MTTPDFIPVLSYGSHSSPEEGACVMEMVSFMTNDNWTDTPKCTNKLIAKAAQKVNDCLLDRDRHLIMSQFDRLFNTSDVDPAVMSEAVGAYVKSKVRYMEKGFIRKGVEHYLAVGLISAAVAGYIVNIGPKNPQGMVEVLSDVLDIYDRLTGRTTVQKQDTTKLKEIQNV